MLREQKPRQHFRSDPRLQVRKKANGRQTKRRLSRLIESWCAQPLRQWDPMTEPEFAMREAAAGSVEEGIGPNETAPQLIQPEAPLLKETDALSQSSRRSTLPDHRPSAWHRSRKRVVLRIANSHPRSPGQKRVTFCVRFLSRTARAYRLVLLRTAGESQRWLRTLIVSAMDASRSSFCGPSISPRVKATCKRSFGLRLSAKRKIASCNAGSAFKRLSASRTALIRR